jgi:hypothetical protein
VRATPAPRNEGIAREFEGERGRRVACVQLVVEARSTEQVDRDDSDEEEKRVVQLNGG